MTTAPDDFTQFAPGKTLPAIAQHYGVGVRTVRHWRLETGVEPIAPEKYARKFERPVPPSFAAIAPTKPISELASYYGAGRTTVRKWLKALGLTAGKRSYACRKLAHGTAPRAIVSGDGSLAARAAEECLRRLAPTYRCDATGAPLHDGFFWRHGNIVLSDDELIARAERKGWSADGWKRIAA